MLSIASLSFPHQLESYIKSIFKRRNGAVARHSASVGRPQKQKYEAAIQTVKTEEEQTTRYEGQDGEKARQQESG